jgi:putative effector of murein hydrolase LrgA (UPF0299 family)
MIRGFAALLLCQLIGEAVARGFVLPVPGPVIGLALLVVGMAVWNRLRPYDDETLQGSAVGQVADGLLAALGLLFVPAGVGVVQYGRLIGDYGVALGVALVVSTFTTLLATVGTFLLVKRLVAAGP